MCLKQFIIYIWTFAPLAKMNDYLRKIVKKWVLRSICKGLLVKIYARLTNIFYNFLSK
jgi:hypothetical protein